MVQPANLIHYKSTGGQQNPNVESNIYVEPFFLRDKSNKG
jgi:hypothetical protein